MPALSYQPWKAAKVESGECRQTIRAMRKRPFIVGDRLYHYAGQRTKNSRKVGESTCVRADLIDMDRNGFWYHGIHYSWGFPSTDLIAQADGFTDSEAMLGWFERHHRFPFKGQVIVWDSIEKATD